MVYDAIRRVIELLIVAVRLVYFLFCFVSLRYCGCCGSLLRRCCCHRFFGRFWLFDRRPCFCPVHRFVFALYLVCLLTLPLRPRAVFFRFFFWFPKNGLMSHHAMLYCISRYCVVQYLTLWCMVALSLRSVKSQPAGRNTYSSAHSLNALEEDLFFSRRVRLLYSQG